MLTKTLMSLVLAVSSLGAMVTHSSADDVVIAGSLPLTGPVAAYSGNYFKGFQLGLDETCAKLNVDCAQFKLDAQDNASQPQQAVTIAQSQLLSNPVAIVSGTSDVSSAIAPFFDDLDVAHFMIAFDARIVEKGASRMRMFPNFKDESLAYLRLIDKLQPKKIVALVLNSSSNTEMFETVVGQGIRDRNIDYTILTYDFDTTDYSNIALKAKEANPDLFMITGYSFQIYPVMKALRSYGVDPSKIVVTMDFIDLIYNGTPVDELKGYYFTSPIYEVPGALPGTEAFRASYKAKYGANPSYVEAYAYDTAALIVAAQAKRGKVDKASIIAVTPFDGVTGKITFDEFGDIKGTTTVSKYGEDGNITEVK